MKAELLLHERHQLALDRFAEIKVWRVPKSVAGSSHLFKYSLALVVDGICVLRYDNEAGKGDHRHAGDIEESYDFVSPRQLMTDFWTDVDGWRQE